MTRDRYADVGRAMRQAIDRALAAGLGDRQWRVFVAVLRQTGSYSKLADRLYLAALAEMVFATPDPTGWQVKRMGQDLRHLAKLGVIERDPPKPGRPKAGSGGARYRVALPRVDPPGNGAAGCDLSTGKGSSERAETVQRARGNGAAGCTPTEEVTEEVAEGVVSGHVPGDGTGGVASTPAPTAALAGPVLPRVDDVGPLEWCRARVTGRTEPGELEAVVTELRTAWPDDLDDSLAAVEDAETDPTELAPPLVVRWPRQLPEALAPHLAITREIREEQEAEVKRARWRRPEGSTA